MRCKTAFMEKVNFPGDKDTQVVTEDLPVIKILQEEGIYLKALKLAPKIGILI
jgi:hypothetical protein